MPIRCSCNQPLPVHICAEPLGGFTVSEQRFVGDAPGESVHAAVTQKSHGAG
jgi:hypothetical protein